jgi:hypothetical protein
MATVNTIDTAGVMGVARRGRHRAPTLDAPRNHSRDTLRFHGFPAPCGPHLTPIEGCWRVRKDALGAGRCCSALQQLSWRPRQGLMAHQERPLYAFHW